MIFVFMSSLSIPIISMKFNLNKIISIIGVLIVSFEMIQVFENILHYNPNSYEAYYNLGILNQKLLNLNKALQYYLKANIINKKNYLLLNKIALIYLKIENIDLSIKFYNESLKINNVNVEAYNNLGRIYLDYFGDINLAIHNHGPEDKLYPSPKSIYDLIKKMDTRMGLCIDIGHTFRAGVLPEQAVVEYGSRLFDLHIKDETAMEKDAKVIEVGRGKINFSESIQDLSKYSLFSKMSFVVLKNGI